MEKDFMKDYWLTNKRPVVVTDAELIRYLIDEGLMVGARVHFTHAMLELGGPEAVSRKLAEEIVQDIMPKMTFETESGYSQSLSARIIVMKEEDLFKLLGRYGVQVHKAP